MRKEEKRRHGEKWQSLGVSKKPQHSNFQDATKNCGFNTFEKPKNIWAESLALKLTPSIAFQFFPFLNCNNGHKQPKKAKKWKSAKISPNGAKRSIQKPNSKYLGNFGSVQVVSVISFHRKCHF